MSYFVSYYNKKPNKGNLTKAMFFLAHGSQVEPIGVGKHGPAAAAGADSGPQGIHSQDREMGERLCPALSPFYLG